LKRIIYSFNFIRLVITFACVLGCQSNSGFTIYQSINIEGLGTSPIVFELPEKVFDDSIKNIFIRLRNDNSYPYTNIFLIVSLQAGEKIITKDTLEYSMASPNGEWLGSGFTEVKESKLWWKEGVIFPKERPLFINLSQAVRNSGAVEGVSKLKGIISVGISIENQ